MFAYIKKLRRAESAREVGRAAVEKATVTIVYDSRGRVVAAR